LDLLRVGPYNRMKHFTEETQEYLVVSVKKIEARIVEDPVWFPVVVHHLVFVNVGVRSSVAMVVRGKRVEVKQATEKIWFLQAA
jgi:hypothetical protein